MTPFQQAVIDELRAISAAADTLPPGERYALLYTDRGTRRRYVARYLVDQLD